MRDLIKTIACQRTISCFATVDAVADVVLLFITFNFTFLSTIAAFQVLQIALS
jgi:hypothetical protein